MKQIISLLLIFSICSSQDFDADIVKTKKITYQVETFSEGYEIPWGMAFLPSKELLVSDRNGALYRVAQSGKQKKQILGVPEVLYKSQGGLLDIAVHPNFSNNKLIYISYSHEIATGSNKTFSRTTSFTRIAMARLEEYTLKDLKVIYKADAKHYTPRAIHFGSRIVFYDNHVYFSVGDSFERDEAQDLNTPNGKIHRLTLKGDVPNDNPFKNKDGTVSSIWTYGNRNPQGLAVAKDGTIWETEHGPRGGDELNIISKGVNYGWPIITYGINYIGTKITDITEKEGMEQPVWHWTPSIAVCGMAIYEHSLFNAWKDNILVTSLKDEYLERVVVKDNKFVSRENIYKPGSRVRDVEVGPNGRIFVALEDPGRIVVLSPTQ